MYLFLDRLVTMASSNETFRRIASQKHWSGRKLIVDGGRPSHLSEIEMEFEKFRLFQSLNISIATNARNREEGEFLFRSLQFPFKG